MVAGEISVQAGGRLGRRIGVAVTADRVLVEVDA
jgi:hypothetical protein